MLSDLFPLPGRLEKLPKATQPIDWLVIQSPNSKLIYMLTWHLGMAFNSGVFFFFFLDTHRHTSKTNYTYFMFHNKLKKIK